MGAGYKTKNDRNDVKTVFFIVDGTIYKAWQRRGRN